MCSVGCAVFAYVSVRGGDFAVGDARQETMKHILTLLGTAKRVGLDILFSCPSMIAANSPAVGKK